MATDHDGAEGLALTPSRVYWGSGEGLIRSIPLDGGNPSPITVSFASHIAVRGDRLYFIDYGENVIKSSYIDGKGAATFATVDQFDTLVALAVDDHHVYWSLLSDSSASIWRAALDGSDQKSLATGNLTGCFILDGSSLYFGVTDSASGTEGGIYRLDLETGQSLLLANGSHPCGLATSDGTLIFTDWGAQGGGIFRMPISGGEPVLVKNLSDGSVEDLVADEAYIYWTHGSAAGGVTSRIPLGGGPVKDIATTPDTHHDRILVDNAHVYFTRYWTEPFGPTDFEEYGVSVLRWCKAP